MHLETRVSVCFDPGFYTSEDIYINIKPKKKQWAFSETWKEALYFPVCVHLLLLWFPPCPWSKASPSVYRKSLQHTPSLAIVHASVCIVRDCECVCVRQGVQWVIITACRPVWLITYCQPFSFCRAPNTHWDAHARMFRTTSLLSMHVQGDKHTCILAAEEVNIHLNKTSGFCFWLWTRRYAFVRLHKSAQVCAAMRFFGREKKERRGGCGMSWGQQT